MILIISVVEDPHIAPVYRALRQYRPEVEVVVLFVEMFGQAKSYYVRMLPDARTMEWRVGERSINIGEVEAIWYRRMKVFPHSLIETTVIERDEWKFAHDHWVSAFENAFEFFQGLWVSNPDAIFRARRKVTQLKVARANGFKIPKTIVTNDPDAILAFLDECPHAIAKPLAGGWFYRQGQYYNVYTTRITKEMVSSFREAVTVAPFIVQEEVRKSFELRVYVVGEEVHAIKIESQKSPISALDWRRYDLKNTPYLPFSLPMDVAQKCRGVVRQFGLQYGAIDIIVTPDGDFVFLEINANGQFLWAERLSGVKVSESIARLLLGITPPL